MLNLLISLVTGAVTLVGMWGAGSLKPWAWKLNLANQVLWFIFIVAFGAWGLLPLNVALVVTYTRNHLRWKREADQLRAVTD